MGAFADEESKFVTTLAATRRGKHWDEAKSEVTEAGDATATRAGTVLTESPTANVYFCFNHSPI